MYHQNQNLSTGARKRNAYVTEHITAAMLSLLEEKPLSEISISELCDRAGVGRVSFYRNFQEKDDILKEHIRQLFREWTGTLKEDPPLDELIRRMFSHFEAHRDFYALLQKRGLTWLLKDVILSVCGFHPEQEAVNAYASAFAAYSLYGWVRIMDGKAQSDNKLSLWAFSPMFCTRPDTELDLPLSTNPAELH